MLAGAITTSGLSSGDRFAVICRNSETYMELLHAGYWSGVIPVPINPRLSPVEIEKILKNTGADLIFVDGKFLSLVRAPLDSAPAQRVVIADSGTHTHEPQYSNLEEFIKNSVEIKPNSPNENDVALILFSGGTTGPEKGILLTHRNIVTNAIQIALSLQINPSDVWLHAAPMFHSADLLANSVTICGGAHSFLKTLTPAAFVSVLEECSITRAMLPPSVVFDLLHDHHLSGIALKSLVSFIVGGAPVPLELREELQSTIKSASVVVGYGLTETSPIVSFLNYRITSESGLSDSAILESVGKPLVGVDVRVVDGDGNHDIEIGELQVRGPSISAGYLEDSMQLKNAQTDEWFSTGDIAKIGPEGHIFILDRLKDVIITDGLNVYSPQVESVLLAHPKIREVAVIGTPDPKHGEIVTAVIVTHDDVDVTVLELRHHCRKFIGVFKIPKVFEITSGLPRSALGKVLKHELRAQFG